MRRPSRTKKLSHVLAIFVVLVGIVSCHRVTATKTDEDLEKRQREYDAFRKSVEEQKKHHDMSASGGEQTWKHYIP